MKKSPPASDPETYIGSLDGWRAACVESLRAAVRGASTMEEAVKWGHLVFSSNGPILLIRAESNRVLLGFWRGQQLRNIEPRLKSSGKYEMATIELHEGDVLSPTAVRRLVKQAVALNNRLGDPRLAAVKRRGQP